MKALAAEHLEDLRRSGLNDASIEKLGLEAVRPHDIKLRGVSSAVRFPYFHLDGTVNCFERWRLYPPITTADGHKQKYYQVPGSVPHLYLPPLFSWKIVATKTDCPVFFGEGEKKSAAMCQHGRFCIGVAGVWNWRQKLETGERLVIPTLDLFAWQGRTVSLVPDSDAWREDKMLSILAGFYCLGQELIARGATVTMLKLPEHHTVKVGLDDFLLAAGDDWEAQWEHLEQFPLDHERLAPVAAWWQKWRAKQATAESLNSQQTEKLEIQELAGQYTVTFPVHHLQFKFERLTDARGGVQAELSISTGAREILGVTDISLKSASARKNLATTLKDISATLPWKRMIEAAGDAVLRRHRQGEPVVVLQPSDSIHVPFVVNPIVYKNHQALIFAPGGSLKSYLALFIALQACHGAHVAGLSALRVPVLYLDWELNAETVGGRLKALRAGHPELAEFVPYYRRCEAPLHQEAPQIARDVAERGIQLLIVDSVAMASGGDLASPDAAIKLQRALRMIGCASLVLAHTSKSVQEGQEKTAYGTVFFRELARNVWELQRAEDTHPVRIALHQKKNNFGPKHPALGFEFTFSPDAVQVTSCNPEDEPEFEDRLPVPARIRNLLEDGVPRAARDIAEELDLKLVTVKSALSRGKGHKWQQIGEEYRNPQWTVLRAK